MASENKSGEKKLPTKAQTWVSALFFVFDIMCTNVGELNIEELHHQRREIEIAGMLIKVSLMHILCSTMYLRDVILYPFVNFVQQKEEVFPLCLFLRTY